MVVATDTNDDFKPEPGRRIQKYFFVNYPRGVTSQVVLAPLFLFFPQVVLTTRVATNTNLQCTVCILYSTTCSIITCKNVASLHCTNLSRLHSRIHSGLVALSTFLNALVCAAVCTLVTATLDNAFACSCYADLPFQQL